MGRYYGYNRVSTKEQHLDRGRSSITAFCNERGISVTRMFEDVQTGRTFDRPRYIVLKEDVLQAGDTLIIPEYDRLGRADQTKEELEHFKKAGVRVIFLDIPTTQMEFASMQDEMAKAIMNCINETVITFYDLMARTELHRKKKRQQEGIQAKKERGEWANYGRPRRMSMEQFAVEYSRVQRGDIGSLALMRELSFSPSTYFKYVREVKQGETYVTK